MKTIQGVELAIKVLSVLAIIVSAISFLMDLLKVFSEPFEFWVSLVVLVAEILLTIRIYGYIAREEECSTLVKVLTFIFMTFAVGVLVCCYHPEDIARYYGEMKRRYGEEETKNPNFLSGIEPVHRHNDEE